MANRTEKITLLLDAKQYIAEYDTVAKKTRSDTDDMKGRLERHKQAYDMVGTASLAVGAAAAAGVGVAIAKFADFDQAMSQVQAATQESASNMTLLRAAALKAGADTVYSATEAAGAIEELGKNGVTTKDILGGGLAAALSIAAAGGVEVSRAAEIAAITMKQFNLQGKDLPHVADLLAAGAGKAAGSVDQLAQAMNQSALVAHQTGITVEETSGTLAAFADAGLLGSDAGTSFKTMLQALNPKSAQAADLMNQLNLHAYDASGQFVGMATYAGNLQAALGKLTPEQRNAAMSVIFGSDAVRAASVLYDQGAEGIKKYIDQTNDSGYAAKVAADRLNNLKGDVEQLNGSLETAFIKTGGGANNALRDLTQGATGLVNVFNGAPEPVQQLALALVGVTAGVGLLGGAFLIGVPKAAAFKNAMKDLDLTTGALAGKVGKGGGLLLGITALIGGFSGLGSTMSLSGDRASELDAALKLKNLDTLNKLFATKPPEDFGQWLFSSTTAVNGFGDALKNSFSGNFFENLGSRAKWIDGATGLTHLGDAAKENEARFRQMGDAIAATAATALPDATAQFAKYVEMAGGGNDKIRMLLDAMPTYKAALIDAAAAQGVTLDQQGLYNLAVGDGTLATQIAAAQTAKNTAELAAMGSTATYANTELAHLSDTIRGFGSLTLDARAATRDLNQATLDAIQAAKDHGRTLDINTQSGIANEAAIDAVAKKAVQFAAATYDQTQSTDAATKALETGRQKLIDVLGQFGITGQAAQDYANKLGVIPGNITTIVNANTGGAQASLDALVNRNQNRVIQIDAAVKLGGEAARKYGFAGGGALDMAPGPKGVDSMMFMGAKGEHVLTAREVDLMGGQGGVYAFRSALVANGGIPGRAEGGPLDAQIARMNRAPSASQMLSSFDAQRAATAQARQLTAPAASAPAIKVGELTTAIASALASVPELGQKNYTLHTEVASPASPDQIARAVVRELR